MGGVAVWRCGGDDDGGMAVVCFLVFLLHSRMLSRMYLPTRSLVTKGQHTLAGHWLFPPSSSFPFTGEGFSLSHSALSLSPLLPSPSPSPSFFLSVSLTSTGFSGVPHKYTNTLGIGWDRRAYIPGSRPHSTTPAPFLPRLLCTSASLPRLLRFVHPTLLYHHRHYRARRARPIFGTLYLSRPSKGPLHPLSLRTVLLSHAPSIGRATSVSLSIGLSLSSRPSYTAPPDAFADRPFLSHPGPR